MSLPPLLSAQSAAAVSDTPMFVSDLGLWLKADAGITLVGGAVDAWADQSGNGRNFSAPGATNRPAYSGTLNGLPILTFDGTTDYLLGNSQSLSLTQNVPGITIISVVKYAPTTNQLLVGFGNGTSLASNRAILGVSTTQWRTGGRRLDADAVAFVDGGTANANYVVHTGILRYSVATAATFVNGVSQVDTSFQTAGNTSNTPALRNAIGCSVAIDTFLNGDLAELIVYRRAITPDERAIVLAYLRAKWGI